jgi:N-sulfoglucosamine sulfohydrolase
MTQHASFFAAFAAVILAILGWTVPTTRADRPNILFILTEDQGTQLSFLETPGLQTPNIDRIARAGVYFDSAFVNYPVCSASKAALYTGLHNHTNGIRANTLNYFKPAAQVTESERAHPLAQRLRLVDEYPSLIELLHEAGYFLGVTHKLHVLPNRKFPFDTWQPHAGGPQLRKFIQQAQARCQPWFMMYNIPNPHRPWPNSDEKPMAVDPAEVRLPGFIPDTPVTRQDWSEYLQAIQDTDAIVGEALQALKATDAEENTLIFFMGDHGPAYHHGKMSLYNFGLQVPLAVSGPGIQRGVRCKELVSEIDLLPTICGLVGIAPPKTLHGTSLLPLLQGSHQPRNREFVYAEIQHGAQRHDHGMQERSVFDGRWKLIYRENCDQPRDFNSDLQYWLLELPNGRKLPWHNRTYDEIVTHRADYPKAFQVLAHVHNGRWKTPQPVYELYDLQNDPWEMDNLANCEEFAGQLDRLRQALHNWAKRTDDRYLKALPAPSTPKS